MLHIEKLQKTYYSTSIDQPIVLRAIHPILQCHDIQPLPSVIFDDTVLDKRHNNDQCRQAAPREGWQNQVFCMSMIFTITS